MTALLAIDSGQSGVRAKLPSGVVRVFAGIRTDAALFPQLAAVVEAALGAPFPEAVGVAADGESAGAASGARPFGDDAFPPAQSAAVAIGTTGLTRLESDPAALLALCRGFGVGRVLLAHDSVTSFLGAMGYGSGVVVAAGTGVVTLGVGERSVARVDGWGNIIGDAGSGYWIGRAGLEAVMRAYDGRSPATALAEVAQASFSSLSGAYIELQTDPDRVARVASFAKQVAELAGRDAVCASICRDAGRELALSAITAARRAGLSEPRVALVGGVFSAPAVKQSCVEALRERWPGFEPAPPLGDALDGAAALAGLPEDHPLAPRVAIAG